MTVPKVESDVVVLGAGPAGLACALTLVRDHASSRVHLLDAGRPYQARRCPVDGGRVCRGCAGNCNVISGFGGSLHYGDGVKLSRFPSGRRLAELLGVQCGERMMDDAVALLLGPDAEDARQLFTSETLAACQLPLKAYSVAPIPSGLVKRMVGRLFAEVTSSNRICLSMRTAAERIEPDGSGFRVLGRTDLGRMPRPIDIRAQRVVVATGRRGQRWWHGEARRLGVRTRSPTCSVGIRLEGPSELLAAAAAIHPDFKVTLHAHGVKVKTFCFCAGAGGGQIKFTDYGDYTLLDGHVAPDGRGTVGNFALLAQLRDGQGVPRSRDWIAERLLTPYRALRTDRPGKPVIQWFPDFAARRVTAASMPALVRSVGFTPSLSDYQVANLAAILPRDVHAAFVDVARRLFEFFAEAAGRSDTVERQLAQVAVIGLELESLWDEVDVSPGMESSAPGLYVCGDCAGLAQGILQAATGGIAAAEDCSRQLAGLSRHVSTTAA